MGSEEKAMVRQKMMWLGSLVCIGIGMSALSGCMSTRSLPKIDGQEQRGIVTEAKITSVESSDSLNRRGSCQKEKVIAVGRSMSPYLFDGESVRGTFGKCASLSSGKMVIYDNDNGAFAIKWLLGMPGDMVGLTDQGQVTINGDNLKSTEGEPYILEGRRLNGMRELQGEIPNGEYLLLGNLRPDTLDSSVHGLVPGEAIRGTAKKTISTDNPVARVDMKAIRALVPDDISDNEVFSWIGKYAADKGFNQIVDKGAIGTFPAVDITDGLVGVLKKAKAEAEVDAKKAAPDTEKSTQLVE